MYRHQAKFRSLFCDDNNLVNRFFAYSGFTPGGSVATHTTWAGVLFGFVGHFWK